jgi:23S rRNA (cytidine1920-2'-O)/16S rRNA (cytidine1409-2'-O)-methyltransferase
LSKPLRLDAELVRRKLAGSRTEAQKLIASGIVQVKGFPVTRAAALVTASDPVTIESDRPRFVSRGGDKLHAALARLDLIVASRAWLDVGASTGGFTDCLLQLGAKGVAAVDVGYGQFDWRLRNDPRVTLIERKNARSLTRADLPWAPEATVADLSFISLTKVMGAVVEVAEPRADHVWMVKPQFELGPRKVGKGGVVRDPALWQEAIAGVVTNAKDLGLGLVDVVPSEVPGPAGNREFFVHLIAGADENLDSLARAVEEVMP